MEEIFNFMEVSTNYKETSVV
jgi:hypothetical protein